MYAEISAAIASAKTALDIAKTAHNLSDFNNLVSAISEVNTKLMDATAVALASQEKQSALTNRITELEDQLRQVENWESQMKRYKLHEFPATKALAYALQLGMEDNEPVHYLCTTCVSKREKTILQPHGRFLYCPICKNNIETSLSPPINRSVIHGGSWR
ncbi:MAG: hypothetical protein PHI06_06445 [Desulfobulbaceae bacterium]|nr:hypothetical protein [Desulfobulbaceae bacterium]